MEQNQTRGGPARAYRLGHMLRAGRGGDIYEAVHPRLAGSFAVKILRPELSRHPESLALFRAEIEAVAALRHPHIAEIVEIGLTHDGSPFVMMERLHGQTLEDRLVGAGPLSLAETIHVVDGVAAGLHAAHSRGVVHREVRAKNVFLAQTDGHRGVLPKILNFGLGRLRTGALGDGSLSNDAAATMAPEQAQGRLDEIDGKADQFALGVLTYRMLTAKNPFRGEDAIALLYQIVHEAPRSLSQLVPCPDQVEAVVYKALSKRRADRFESTVAFARALEQAASPTTQSIRRPLTASERPPRPSDQIAADFFQAGEEMPAGPVSEVEDEPMQPMPVRRHRGRRALLVTIALLAGLGGAYAVGWRPLEWRNGGTSSNGP